MSVKEFAFRMVLWILVLAGSIFLDNATLCQHNGHWYGLIAFAGGVAALVQLATTSARWSMRKSLLSDRHGKSPDKRPWQLEYRFRATLLFCVLAGVFSLGYWQHEAFLDRKIETEGISLTVPVSSVRQERRSRSYVLKSYVYFRYRYAYHTYEKSFAYDSLQAGDLLEVSFLPSTPCRCRVKKQGSREALPL